MAIDETLVRRHFYKALRAAPDEETADRIYAQEKASWRKMRDAPIPRPELKFEVQRENSTLKHRDEIFAMLADMNARHVPEDVQRAEVLKSFEKRFPGDVSKSSLDELIDGSSECTSERNQERLLKYPKRMSTINKST
jgi:hypothetical protein